MVAEVRKLTGFDSHFQRLRQRDITEKKRLEQQFLRAQRLESLGTLASGIAHDLNNVLTPIVGAAQLLQVTLPTLDERSQRLLTMLVESSLRGSSLVKQILTFARGVDGQRTVLKLQHILVETITYGRLRQRHCPPNFP